MPLGRIIQSALNAGIDIAQPVIVDEFPHDRVPFTQDPAHHDGRLYESTGHPVASSLRLDGIAYDADDDCFYVTEKHSPLLFQIEIPPGRASGDDTRS